MSFHQLRRITTHRWPSERKMPTVIPPPGGGGHVEDCLACVALCMLHVAHDMLGTCSALINIELFRACVHMKL